MKQYDKIFKCLGASNHCKDDREENDYYATSRQAITALLNYEKFSINIWENCVGGAI